MVDFYHEVFAFAMNTESRAITQYISHTCSDKGTQLVFAGDAKKMDAMGAWMEVESHQFDPSASKLAFELLFKPMFGLGAIDEQAVVELTERLVKVLDIYEARLAQNKYMSGDCFGLANLHHLPVVHVLKTTPVKALFEAHPPVSTWAAEILAWPAWAKVLDMHKGA